MKVIIVLTALLAAAAVARPAELTPGITPILDFQLSRDSLGQFAATYTSGDATKVEEQGALVPNKDNTDNVLVKKGSFSYYAPDGTLIEETWVADANGFRAMGKHLPVSPSVPSSA